MSTCSCVNFQFYALLWSHVLCTCVAPMVSKRERCLSRCGNRRRLLARPAKLHAAQADTVIIAAHATGRRTSSGSR
jgi:hypothetical protein